MSTSITTAFVAQYESEVHHLFQRYGGILRAACRTKTNVVGSTTTFQKIGKGSASTKARHGVITPMNVDHTAPTLTLVDFYAGDWVDRLDEAKIQHDERMALAQAGAWALGRKVDDQILTELDNTSQTTASWSVAAIGNIENSLLGWIKAIDALDVPADGQRYAVLSAFAWSAAMKVQSFARADYRGPDGLPYTEGAPVLRWKDWNGVKWCVHTGLSGHGTATSKGFMWHKNAIGYATGAHPSNAAEQTNAVMADITWHGDRAAHFINHWMSGGAKLIDDTGVVECDFDDTASLPTS